MEEKHYYLFTPSEGYKGMFDYQRFGVYLKENNILPYKISCFKFDKVYKGKKYYLIDRLITRQKHDWMLIPNILSCYGFYGLSVKGIVINTIQECPNSSMYEITELTYKEFCKYRDKCKLAFEV